MRNLSIVNGNLFTRPRTRHQSTTVLDVEFADDAALFAPTLAAVQLALETLHRISSAFGLTINFSKTKFVSCGTAAEVYEPLVIAGQEVEHVSSFVYLGSLVDPDSRVGLGVDRHLFIFYF